MSWNKLAALGEWSTVFPLKSCGIDVTVVLTPEDAPKMLRKLVLSKEYAVIFVQESLHSVLHDTMREFSELDVPAIILIPSVSGSEGYGLGIIRDTMKKAAGRDILAEE